MKTISSLFLAPLLALPTLAFAQSAPATYTLMAPLGGVLEGSPNLTTYLQGIVQVTIGIAGILAVIMIVVCGIKLMGTPSASGKSEAKECIWNAIFGVLLALGAWILLNTINPLLLSNELSLGDVQLAPATVTGSATPPSGNYSWSANSSCGAVSGKIVAAVPPSYCTGTAPSESSVCCGYVDSPIRPLVETPFSPPPTTETGGGGGTGTTPPPTIIPPPSSGLQFTTTRFSVLENAGNVLITVTRTGPTTDTISVNYATQNDTAIAEIHYTTANGTITFLPGVTTRTFRVPIIDNTIVDGNKQFSVRLSNPSSGVVLNTSTAPVTIVDNEVALPPPPPDTTAPMVNIINPTSGFISTIALIPVDFSVTENLLLNSVTITAIQQLSGLSVFTQTICSSATTPCATLGFTGTTAVDVLTVGVGSYLITVTACDKAGNCGKGSVLGQYNSCTTGDLRCTSDYVALADCIGRSISGSCTKADLNKDGQVNNSDLMLLSQASAYDINKDGTVDPTTTTTNFNDTCFFHTTQDPLLPCALRVFGNITLTATDRSTLGVIYEASKTSPYALSLSLLDAKLCATFGCTTAGSGLGGTDQLSIYGESMLTTFREYDFNGDGIVDGDPFSADMEFFQSCLKEPTAPGCVNADMNLDGYITYSDLNLLTNAMWAWSESSITLSNLERIFWTGTLQPEAGILSICKGASLVLLCGDANLNADTRIDSADLTFLQGVKVYDVNGDGLVVYGTPNLPTPISTATTVATSTKFTIGDVVATTQGVIVRKDVGDTAQFLGTIPAGATGKIIGGPVFTDGNWWWKVSYDGSFVGWSVETYLTKTTLLPPPPPPSTSTTSTKFVLGDRVGSTANLNVRASASLSGTFIGIIPLNTTKGTVVGGPVSANGYWWWQVKWDSGISGWSAENWLKEFVPPPAPKITAPLNGSYASATPVVIKGTLPTAEAGGMVEVFRSGTVTIGQTTITKTGAWSISSPLSDGVHIVTAVATDQSDNVGPTSTPVTFTLDTVSPSAPTVTAPTTIVRSETVTLSGTASEAGTLSLYNTSTSGTLLGTVTTVAPGNTWTFTKTDYVDGTYTFAIIERDPAGNVSPVKLWTVVVDAPPPAPTIIAPVNGFITNQTTVIVSGTGATQGDTINLYAGAILIGSTNVTSTKTWSLTFTGLTDGVRTVYAVEVDPGLNQSAPSASVTFTVDTVPPGAPVITAPGATVSTATFIMSGTAESGSTVKIYRNSTSDTLLGSITANSAGIWSFTLLNYANATYTFAVTATDKAMNVSTPSTITVQVMAPPPAPQITFPANGASTNQRSVSGIGAVAGNSINLYTGSTFLGTMTLTTTKTWSILTSLLDGVYTLSATEFDPVLSLTSAPSPAVTFTLDTTPPPAPTLTSPTNGSSITSSGVTFNGTGSQSGNTITIYVNGFNLLATTIKGTLSWSVKYVSAPSGTYSIEVTETDQAGNISAKTAPITITVI